MRVPAPQSNAAWQARLRLACELRQGRSVLAERRHEGPLVVQKALYPEGAEVCHAILVHPPGGMAGGDELDIDMRVRPEAHLLATTPGATRWYRANGRAARQSVRFDVAAGGCAEWLPQENILFDAACVRMDTHITLAEGARYLGWEINCFGRIASGERFATGEMRQSATIRIDGRLVWNERACVDASSPLFDSPVGLAGHNVSGTLLLAGATVPAPALERCRARVACTLAGERSGVSSLPQVLVARYLGASAERCRELFAALWAVLRPATLGREACLPRVWRT